MTDVMVPRRAAVGVGPRRLAHRFRALVRTRLVLVAQVGIMLMLLLLWELGAGDPRKGAFIDEFFIGRPSSILQALIAWWRDGTMYRNVWITVQEGLVGFAIGSILAIVLGFAMGVTSFGRNVLAPLVFSTYALPRVGFAPLFILWFGLGMASKIALVVVLVFYLTFFNTFQGAREVDADLIAVCRLMRASSWQILLKVTVPSAMVWVALGLKVSVPYAFVGAVIGEIIAGDVGLGGLITRAVNQFNPNGLMAAVLLTTCLAITLNAVVSRVTGYLLQWQDVGGARGRAQT